MAQSLHPDQSSTSNAASPPSPFVTETMAELYLRQGFREEALEVFRQLLVQRPNDLRLQERVRELTVTERMGAPDAPSKSPPEQPATVISTEIPAPTARQVLGQLAARRVVLRAGPSAQTRELPSAVEDEPSRDEEIARLSDWLKEWKPA